MKILFIGNRTNVFQYLYTEYEYEIDLWVLQDSLLHRYALDNNLPYVHFGMHDRHVVIKHVEKSEFDVIISNGCPFILPVIQRPMYNIHPTPLPYLKGFTPLNGVFLQNMSHLGATMHEISEEVDGGHIIHQVKVPLTDDIDQGLVYYISFDLEREAFKGGWKKLLEKDFDINRNDSTNVEPTFYNRKHKDMSIDFSKMSTDEIMTRIKAFGIRSQGVGIQNTDIPIKKVYDASAIVNPYMKEKFKNLKAGDIALRYDEKLLVKTLDGLIRLCRYE